MPKTIKIKVDPNLCIGAASCVVLAPDFYELNAEGKAVVKLKEGGSQAEATLNDLTDQQVLDIRAGAESCPTKAIFLHDEAGKQIYP